MSVRGNFSRLVEISKNLKKCVSNFVAPNMVKKPIPKLKNIASLNVEFYKFGWNNQNLSIWKILIAAYFPIAAHCETH